MEVMADNFYRKTNFPIRAKNSLTSYWLIYKPTKKNDRPVLKISKQTIHCLCKTHQNSLQSQDNVIVVSGHDHNLQFIDKDNIKQIISGAGSKSTAAINQMIFLWKNGYATLDLYENGKSTVSFSA
jgi:predicted oxidoreductase (fatty acid repression mutant protein)